ncbi:MAG: substrate-binding domain-containing protein, partial [Sulfurospirillum sp.]|nr:substrate-binding domain-containing protein [Sulfurospirillum sp.]
VASYVSTHEVDVGIINLSAALDNYTKIGGYIKIPEQYYTKIEIVAARLGSCQKNVSCQSFLEFLKTPEAQKIFEKYGL